MHALSDFPFNHIVIVGLGLVGGSIAKSIKKLTSDVKIVAVDTSSDVIHMAKKEKVIDIGYTNLPDPLADEGIVVICTMPDTTLDILRRVEGLVGKNVVVTETAGIKHEIASLMEASKSKLTYNYVGSHPMTGKEVQGYTSSSDGIFKSYPVFIIKSKFTAPSAVGLVSNFWEFMGAKVFYMDSSTHDKLIALISHLPHVISYTLAKTILDCWPEESGIPYIEGSGLKDMVRIAKSDVDLWSKLIIANSENMTKFIDAYMQVLYACKELINRGDVEELKGILRPNRIKK